MEEMAIGFGLIILIGAIVSGVIGLFLGGSVNKGTAGFWLGLFLGPIGWIIVLLLPRETSNSRQTQTQTQTQTQKPKERLTRDLSSDEYKVMLGKKYEITRNELFDKFESDGKLFESLDAALKYADELEAKAVKAEIVTEQANQANQAERAEKDLSKMTFADIQKKLEEKQIWATMPIWKMGYTIEGLKGEKQHFETLSQLREYYRKVMNI
jgi:uncharacterized membrane-anchored protein YhcB (DUF1043 family)